MSLLSIAKELTDAGFELTMVRNTESVTNLGIRVPGFAKSNYAELIEIDEAGSVVALTRYGDRDLICDVDDLIHLNDEWVNNYADRGYGITSDWVSLKKIRR